MAGNGHSTKRNWRNRNTYLLVSLAVWSGAIAASFGLNLVLDRDAVVSVALAEARAIGSLENNADSIAEQGHKVGGQSLSFRAHILSLDPNQPKDTADDWERTAMKALARGVGEVSEVRNTDGQSELRLVRPLIVGRGCLKCHAGQKVGEVRGAISIEVPLAPLWEAQRPHIQATQASYGLIWLIGACGVLLATGALHKRIRESAESEAKFRELFDSAPVAYHELDRQGVIRGVNRAECALLGFKAEQMLGRPVWEFVAESDRESSREAIRRKLAGEQPTEPVQRRYTRSDGSEVLLEIHDSLVRSVTGETSGLRSALLDITERVSAEQALRESEETLRTVSASAFDAIVMMDTEGRAIMWNPAAERMFGYTADEILGQPFHDLVAPADLRTRFQEKLPAFRETGQGDAIGTVMELTAVRKDGSKFPVELALAAVQKGEQWQAVGFVSDITERKEIEERIERYLHGLEDARELQDRNTAELKRMVEQLAVEKERAEVATRAKSQFLSSMSHEIRTPMNGVIGMTGLLLDTPLTPEQQGYAETIRSSADALLGIINDILDFSKIEAGKLDLEIVPFDLHNALEDVVELLALKAQEKNLELLLWYAPHTPREFMGDPGRIRQVVLNLVSNAIKFTERGYVLVKAENTETSGGSPGIRIAIHDTGVGIPASRQGLLFQKFQQLDSSTTRKYGGTGLGLAISRQLVELMGGTIGVVSEVGEGSTFSVVIPLRPNPASHTESLKAANLDGVRVLVVDDHQISRFVVTELCKRWGMRADEVASGEDALRMVVAAVGAGDPYRLICLDYMMPGMNGEETVRRLREMEAGGEAGVILISSTAERSEINRLAAAGCDACLVKPLREAVLLDSVRRVLASREAGITPPMWTRHSPPHSTAARPCEASRFAGRRVLLVEDNIVNQKVGAALLGKLGCRVDLAANGREAVDLASKLSYDLIFMDCQMPEMDGFEATVEIRKRQGAHRHTPIVALTAGAFAEDRERCAKAGMDDFVSKPVGSAAIEAMVGRWIASPESRPQGSPTIS